VTLNGQAVAGQVVFVGTDKTEVASPIAPDGMYRVNNPPKGQATVLVKGTGTPAGGALPKDTKGPDVGGGSTGVAPPAKYATAAGGLTFDVTGGEQTFNIELKP